MGVKLMDYEGKEDSIVYDAFSSHRPTKDNQATNNMTTKPISPRVTEEGLFDFELDTETLKMLQDYDYNDGLEQENVTIVTNQSTDIPTANNQLGNLIKTVTANKKDVEKPQIGITTGFDPECDSIAIDGDELALIESELKTIKQSVRSNNNSIEQDSLESMLNTHKKPTRKSLIPGPAGSLPSLVT